MLSETKKGNFIDDADARRGAGRLRPGAIGDASRRDCLTILLNRSSISGLVESVAVNESETAWPYITPPPTQRTRQFDPF
jgi:hypothetical protein